MYDGGIRLQSYNGSAALGCLEWDGTNFRGYNGAWVNLDEVGHDAVTLAASASTGGMSLSTQEIGNQAAGAATPVAAAITSLGDVDTEVRRLNTTTWAEDTWWTSGEYKKEIFRHDGGTTWTSFVNASDTGTGGGYVWHVWHGGELWTGAFTGADVTHRIWSFNPDTEVWTGRGGAVTSGAYQA